MHKIYVLTFSQLRRRPFYFFGRTFLMKPLLLLYHTHGFQPQGGRPGRHKGCPYLLCRQFSSLHTHKRNQLFLAPPSPPMILSQETYTYCKKIMLQLEFENETMHCVNLLSSFAFCTSLQVWYRYTSIYKRRHKLKVYAQLHNNPSRHAQEQAETQS